MLFEIVILLIFICFTLFIFITLALVNCVELSEDPSTENKKNTTPQPKVEKANAVSISKQKVPPSVGAVAPTLHEKVPPVKKSEKHLKMQTTLPKVSGPHPQPTVVNKSQRSVGSLTKSKVSHSKSMVTHKTSMQLPAAETKITSKAVVSCKSTAAVKEEVPKQRITKPGAKPKLPYYPELGPLLVDQQLYDKLKKKYDLSFALPSTTEGKSSSISNVHSADSDGSSHLSRFKTQSFGGSLSKCSPKIDLPSTNDGVVEKAKKEVVKEAKQQ